MPLIISGALQALEFGRNKHDAFPLFSSRNVLVIEEMPDEGPGRQMAWLRADFFPGKTDVTRMCSSHEHSALDSFS
ncbi:MAG TPA: hypothetical protein ENJ29_13050 [Bacteroidetes bacterium]|nr:hypothetical protein [Bacteroidota bacterium]